MNYYLIRFKIFWLIFLYYTVFDKISTGETKTKTQKSHDVDALKEKIRDISYYLRAHKFNEYDRRYETKADEAKQIYFKSFPRPPLRSLHWEVHKFCEPSFMECIDYLSQKVRATAARRSDDTSVIMREQKWTIRKNEAQILQVDKECQANKRADDNIADPFEGPLERYQWRVTASYFLCWYTMKETPELSRFYEKCDNFANCLDYEHGPNNDDERVSDYENFSCALYSFCPDPCCPFKYVKTMKDCWDSDQNPCFRNNPKRNRMCSLNMSENTEFSDLILNRWNVTCRCAQHRGFEWNSRYGMCIDIDECVSETHNCKHKIESCLNLPGSFRCICHWGYIWDDNKKECLPSTALAVLKLKKKEKTKIIKMVSFWEKLKIVLLRKSGCTFIKVNFGYVIYSVLLPFLLQIALLF